ncbi:MAG: response regulator [Nitrospirae bacterium]|nr:response regulator [Nitrospirota bacterium]
MRNEGLHVLLAEDNEDDVVCLKEMLADSRLTVSLHIARDGLEALRFLMKHGKYKEAPTPDLVLLDLGLPKVTGFEVLQYMRKDPELSRLPKLVLTGLSDSRWVEQGIEMGADAYLMKPLSPAVLREALRLHLRDGAALKAAGTGEETGGEILIVEDNDDDVLLFREALAGARWEASCRFIKDGDEAMSYLLKEGVYAQARRPSLVVLDLHLPRRDGLDVLHRIKTNPRLWDLPVVIFSTSDREEDIRQSYERGACLYVTKPARFEEFQSTVRKLSFWLPFMAGQTVMGGA